MARFFSHGLQSRWRSIDWNVWHWLRLPSLGDIRALRKANESACLDLQSLLTQDTKNLSLSLKEILGHSQQVARKVDLADGRVSLLEQSLQEALRVRIGELSSFIAAVRDEWRKMNEVVATRDEKHFESISDSFGKLGEDVTAQGEMLLRDYGIGNARIESHFAKLLARTREFENTLIEQGRAGFEQLAGDKDAFKQSASAFFANGGDALKGLARQTELTTKQIEELIAIATSLREIFDLFLVNNLIDNLKVSGAAASSKGTQGDTQFDDKR